MNIEVGRVCIYETLYLKVTAFRQEDIVGLRDAVNTNDEFLYTLPISWILENCRKATTLELFLVGVDNEL